MKPDQVNYFIKNYFKKMDEELDEIPEKCQERMILYLRNLAYYADHRTQESLGCNPRPQMSNLSIKSSVEGSLSGDKKKNFLRLYCCNISKLFSLKVIDDFTRCYNAKILCEVSLIDRKTYLKWLPHQSKSHHKKKWALSWK